jgi:hypothetical protein
MDTVRRRRRALVAALLALALVTGLVGIFAVWVSRQALNAEKGAEVSSKLLANPEIRDTVGAYLVDQLFDNVDVAAQLEAALPPQLQRLAGPADLVARVQLLRFIENDNAGGALSTTNGEVVLDLHVVLEEFTKQLGIGATPPVQAGRLVLLRANQIQTARDVAQGIRRLAVVALVITLALFALAVWLAAGWRRVALRRVGWCLIGLGVLVMLMRRYVGNSIVDSLVPDESIKPAVHAAWSIITQLLFDLAVIVFAYGVIVVAAAWLAGPTRAATAVRRALAPALRHNAIEVYAAMAMALLLVFLWGPTPATQSPIGIVTIVALAILGLELLRRQTAREFPDAQRGETVARMKARWARTRGRGQLKELEKLAALHDRGALTDEEFDSRKVLLLNGSAR